MTAPVQRICRALCVRCERRWLAVWLSDDPLPADRHPPILTCPDGGTQTGVADGQGSIFADEETFDAWNR